MQPTFVISIDEELIWGSFDHTADDRFRPDAGGCRAIVRDLLALFDRYEVPVTWALVGHLFLGHCERGSDGRAHSELTRPKYRWYRDDWFGRDPCTSRRQAPLWYGDDLLDLIRAARQQHEVGSHSFSHLVYGDPGCSEAAARDDLAAVVASAEARGLTMQSFVFPRNAEGHHRLLKDQGFLAYRGEDPTWYQRLPSPGKRLGHFVDQLLAVAPPVSLPIEKLPGLWNISGSMLLMPRTGPRRLISAGARVQKAKLGLSRAIRERKVFHLWFHPFNLADDREVMFTSLEEIVAAAARLRDQGQLAIATMGRVASDCAKGRSL